MSLEDEIVEALKATINSGQYLQGEQVASLERHITKLWGSPVAVATSSGTTALQLALMAAGIKQGDEVIVPALTFASTSFAVNAVGATPVFVDIDPLTLTMDPMAARRAISTRTAAIIPVHLYGRVANMDWFCGLAREYNLKLIEDCAQAHGARYGDKYVGTMGDFGCFSFWVGKIAGGLEDAGMILAADAEDWGTILKYRDIGRLPGERYKHHTWGLRGRMGEFTARVIQIEMAKFDEWTARRRAIAATYDSALSGLPLQLPQVSDKNSHVYYKYTPLADSMELRQRIEECLQAAAVQTERIYPELVPDQEAYTSRGPACRVAPLPVARDAVQRLTCLPIYPELTDDEINRVIAAVQKACTPAPAAAALPHEAGLESAV